LTLFSHVKHVDNDGDDDDVVTVTVADRRVFSMTVLPNMTVVYAHSKAHV